MSRRVTVPLSLLAAAVVGACAPAMQTLERVLPSAGPPPPSSPMEAPPGVRGDSAAWKSALNTDRDRIVVSRDARMLWLMRGDSAVFAAPIAVGRDTIFRYGQNEWDFNTPTGRMTVLGKEESPLWVPPNWHYYEKAVEQELQPIHLRSGQRVALSDSTVIEVRGDEVGRINRYGHWRAFTPGGEIIFDGKIFVPPIGSPQRRIPDVLGSHRLILGDGYLIHGTPYEDSIGEWASHGCVRMLNKDVEQLYGMVEVRTPVYIY